MSARREPKRRDKRSTGRHGSLHRGTPSLQPRPRVLIVCEGSKTEPNYFNGLRRERRLPPTLLMIVGGHKAGGPHPKKLVEHAAQRMKAAKRSGNPFDGVWCVFDRDVHEDIDRAFIQARDKGINVAFSNPSFELWYLLHYQDQGARIERDAVVDALQSHYPAYDKADEDAQMYDLLKGKRSEAMKRARRLRIAQHHIEDETCRAESPNPSTWVDKLVEYLLSLYGNTGTNKPQ